MKIQLSGFLKQEPHELSAQVSLKPNKQMQDNLNLCKISFINKTNSIHGPNRPVYTTTYFCKSACRYLCLNYRQMINHLGGFKK